MSEIVLGIGTSHTPMLFTDPSDWPRYETRDRKMELLDVNGEIRSYDELVASEGIRVASALEPDALARAYDACQSHLERLAHEIDGVDPDAIIVIGDDQKELFSEENLPAMLLYVGDSILNKMRCPKAGEPSWWSEALAKYYGDGKDEPCPVDASLARHLAAVLNEHHFDLAIATGLPEGLGEGHAFAFVHSRLLRRKTIPVVPLFLNTYYPPNQPTPERCYRLGQHIRKAVETYPRSSRVAVIASGGLSHFVVNEELDARVLKAMADKDSATLTALPTRTLSSGTSEVRNWIALHGATEHLTHQWTGYVPAYRTPAGTGTGCGFGVWR